ncbi:Cys-tRNA(Pro) deacylase [Oceanobacillus halophilus]|uniref:Cys-tRNA(Pro)/Cys-tRNA(Cys) deacylase n=1 Tax=Oceanobacillus halophilus TaxID=930130 RepID=A0A494ZVG3_9BACI|nr:Cys-tRNA(Pro) deacylase [Oceanobacillus halophilus]RKQ30513.1 Cys-tRNA(Pro) deacylase [Oceanobacillus halophilus]
MKKSKKIKTNAIRLLDKEKIRYNIHEYEWNEDHLDAKSAAANVGKPLNKIFKTLVSVGDKTGVIVSCIPSSSELNLKALAKVSGNKKVEMLPMKELEKTTGYIRGGCSPLGMKKQYKTYLSSKAETMESIVVSAGKRGLQVELDPADLKQITDAAFAEIITV